MENKIKRISERDYFNRMDYWDEWAYDNGGIEVFSNDTGYILYTIGVNNG